jgi:TonB family protein
MLNAGRSSESTRKGPHRSVFLLALVCLAGLAPIARPEMAKATTGWGLQQDLEKLAVKKVQPPYPPMAEKYKIEGVVTVSVTVANGKVSQAEFVRGPNVFRSVSLDAAKRWEFKSSESVEGVIHFTFKLER